MRTASLVAMAVGAILGAGRSAVAQDPTPAGGYGRADHIFLVGPAHLTLDVAMRGAIRRLSTVKCQQVFADFTDQVGRALTTTLAATGRSPVDLLAELYFVDADEAIQCRKGDAVVAFTTPGGRVIHVCGKRFIGPALNRRGGEIVLIHELLHALGLGENPRPARGSRMRLWLGADSWPTGTAATGPGKFGMKEKERYDEEISTRGRLFDCHMWAGRHWVDRLRGPGPVLDHCRAGPGNVPCFG